MSLHVCQRSRSLMNLILMNQNQMSHFLIHWSQIPMNQNQSLIQNQIRRQKMSHFLIR
jgi:hypothetical protein